MKFALINGEKCEPIKGAKGLCQLCGSVLIAKCGEVNLHHWAHKGNRNCDPWWENETEWHRSWKDKFPKGWQEFIQHSDSGEKHIADVKTESGYVLEFQHSYLNPDERRSRNAFYPKLVWIVHGSRRPTDISQFQRAFDDGTTVLNSPPIKRVHFPDECRLLKEWSDSNALVFFDFRAEGQPELTNLWFLYPKLSSGDTYISPFSRVKFIELHNNNNKFDEFLQSIILPILNELNTKKPIQPQSQPDILSEIHRRMARVRMKRRF
jgi:hypothetical protein